MLKVVGVYVCGGLSTLSYMLPYFFMLILLIILHYYIILHELSQWGPLLFEINANNNNNIATYESIEFCREYTR